MKKDNAVNRKRSAERIRGVRNSLGYTQEYMAEKIGITREGYQKLESGENNLSLETLNKFRHVFGVSSDYLLYGEQQTAQNIWFLLENSDEFTKLEIYTRLVMYFGYEHSSLFTNEEFKLQDFVREVQRYSSNQTEGMKSEKGTDSGR